MSYGWHRKRLGDIISLNYGKPLPQTRRASTGKYPVYGANGVKAWSNEFFHDQKSVIVGRKGSAGEVNLSEEKFWPLDVTYFVTFDETEHDLMFIYYLLMKLELPKLAKGVKPGINRNDVYTIEVEVPPLPEQKRIVAILDEAFEGIATATANAEKNLANARELVESVLKNTFSTPENRWTKDCLENVVDDECSLSYGIVQPGKDFTDGLPIVRPTDLTRKVIDLSGLKRINPELAEAYSRTKLVGDELLLCVRGTTGTVSVASEELMGANVTRGIVPIRFNDAKITQKFGYYLLISATTQNQIKENTYGAALMQINLRDLRKIVVTYPTLSEQRGLLLRLESLENDTQRLEAIYQQKFNDLSELKQSILRKAFSGELTQKAA